MIDNKTETIAKIVSDGANAVVAGAQAAKAEDASKPLIKSKTFWANAIIGGSSYLGLIPAPYAVPATIAINLLLRFLTNKPISGIFSGN